MRFIDADDIPWIIKGVGSPVVTKEEIDNMPTVYELATRDGKWKKINPDSRGYTETYECTNCEYLVTMPYAQLWMDYDYCPYCGARMKGEEK